mgnify:CR=1 FL=1
MSFPPRLGYWVATVGLIGGSIGTIHWLLTMRFFTRGLPAWLIATIAVVAAVPGAALVRRCLAIWSPAALDHVSFLGLTAQVLLINLVAGGLILALRRCTKDEDTSLFPPGHERRMRATGELAERLPPALRQAELIALEGEDHYLRVYTTAGSTLIYLRLSEAEALLQHEDGLRVHRSYWVARNAVEGGTRSRGRTMLRLTGGLVVPVSRTRQRALVEARWLS